MDIKNEILWRIYLIALLISISGILIFVQAAKIQTKEGDKWRNKADSLYLEFRPINAQRGNILSSDGSLLATSLPQYEVRMDTRADGLTDELFQNNIEALSKALATLPNNKLSPGGWNNKIREGRQRGDRYLLIKRKVSHPELTRIKKFPLFNKGSNRGGLIALPKGERKKPFGFLAKRTIGYVKEGVHPVGLEGSFDEVLAGEKGTQLMQKVAGSKWIPVHDITAIEPKHGKDIKTTLDIRIQDITENALYKAINYHDAKNGCAIVMEVNSGKILAIANLSRTKEGKIRETYNYAVGSSTEPGSTFKLPTLMALLEDGYINLSDSIDLQKGRMTFAGERMEDATYHMIEKTTIRHAFEISSNVGMAQLVNKHYKENDREERYIERLREFQLSEKTKIKIAGEGEPYIKEAFQDNWSGTTMPWMSIGYELRITPLQMLTFYNAVANNGKMMRPYIVSEIMDNGRTVKRIYPEVIKRHLASKQTINKAQELLRGVVVSGTAKNINTDRVAISGKTGTAILDYSGRTAGTRKYQASFAGYFPAENPKYSCIVLITAPKKNGFYGSQVAAPVFKEVAQKVYATDFDLHQAINRGSEELDKVESAPKSKSGYYTSLKKASDYLHVPVNALSDEEWVSVTTRNDSLKIRGKNIVTGLIPDVRGMGLRDAMFLLENVGCRTESTGSGRVVSQSIKPGTRADRQYIKLKLQ